MDWIADAIIAPTMPAGTGDGDVEAAAGQSLASNMILGRSIQHQQGRHGR